MGFHAGLIGVEKGYFFLVKGLFMKGESNGVCDSVWQQCLVVAVKGAWC